MRYVFIIIPIIFTILCYYGANYREMILVDKNELFQYKYAKYISNYKNPTLLNMGSLDAGLYTTTGIVPNTKFFEVQNIDYKIYPDNIDDMNGYVRDKKVKFVLYNTKKNLENLRSNNRDLFNNYELVYSDSHVFEHTHRYNTYLFKLKMLDEMK